MKKLLSPDNFSTRDPFVMKHNGLYYRCFTKDAASVWLSCAATIDGLSCAEEVLVYKPEPGLEYSCHLWAPELHVIENRCYIYVACDDGNTDHHRMYVLENGSDNPMLPYTMHGKISDSADKYAIDGTVMYHCGARYFIWSGRAGDVSGQQNLYIAKMDGPCSLSTERILLSIPEYEWEKRGGLGIPGKSYINEGPFAFTVQDQTYLTYSAAGSWCEDYCIALMKLVGEDPLDPSAWQKMPAPIFSGNDKVKGAGHCSVICEEDQMHVFFHAWDRDETDIVWRTVSVWHAELKAANGTLVLSDA